MPEIRVRTGWRRELDLVSGTWRWRAFAEIHHDGRVDVHDSDRLYDSESEAYVAARAIGKAVHEKFPDAVNRTPPR